MNVGFLIKKLRTDKYSVYCRVSFGKDKGVPFSTGVVIDKKENWINKRGRNFTILNKERNAKVKTDTLLFIKSDLEEIYLGLRRLKKPINAKVITDIYLDNEKPPLTTLQLVHEHVENQILRDLEVSTKTGYKRYRSDFENFCKIKSLTHIPATEFSITKAKQYFQFLRNKPNSEQVAKRKVKLIENVLLEATKDRRIDLNPLDGLDIKIKREKKPFVFLFQDELERIENKSFEIERLEKVRLAFLFSCYTGFHFNQMKIFNPKKHIFIQNGKELISTNRDKNNNYIGVPMFQKTRDILEKCNYKLSIPANSHYNSYLREIADLCGITKHLTSKVGRKTFTNMQINVYGVNKSTVSRMLGHDSVRTTEKHYGDIDHNTIFRETDSQI